MAKKPSKSPNSNAPSGGDGGGGKGEQIAQIQKQIDEVDVQIKQAQLEDKQGQLNHVQTVNGSKQEIRSVVEQTWQSKVESANSGLQVQQTKTQTAQEKVGQEEEIASLNKTLGDERVAKVRRKVYAVHEFDLDD